LKTSHIRVALLTVVLAIFVLGSPLSSAAWGAPIPSPAATMNMQNMSNAQTQGNTDRSLGLQPDTALASPVNGIDWSIFNHRGAGFFILLWGLTAFFVGLQWPRRTWLRFLPPLFLLGLVEFLVLRNDPKAWPTGPIGFWVSNQDPATLQHRIFVLLILAIAVVELFRAADRLSPFLRVWALPALAVLGAVYLFFHKHGGLAAQQMMQSMSTASAAANPAMKTMIASMSLVKHEHLLFSLCGFGLAAAKLLADGGVLKGRLGATLWTVFAIILGIYMLGYTEIPG
jgi:hypothetical protein